MEAKTNVSEGRFIRAAILVDEAESIFNQLEAEHGLDWDENRREFARKVYRLSRLEFEAGLDLDIKGQDTQPELARRLEDLYAKIHPLMVRP